MYLGLDATLQVSLISSTVQVDSDAECPFADPRMNLIMEGDQFRPSRLVLMSARNRNCVFGKVDLRSDSTHDFDLPCATALVFGLDIELTLVGSAFA